MSEQKSIAKLALSLMDLTSLTNEESEQDITLLCGRWPRTEVVSVSKKGIRAAQSFGSTNPY